MISWIKDKLQTKPTLKESYMTSFKKGIGRGPSLEYEDYPIGWIYNTITLYENSYEYSDLVKEFMKTEKRRKLSSYGWHYYNLAIL